jgi:Mn2+/Fe2+ NRAMP family transporter
MMVIVVYLSSKLGQVAGQGLTAVTRQHYPKWVPWLTVAGLALGSYWRQFYMQCGDVAYKRN